MTTSGRISRRTVLRGAGAVVALPFLEAMLPHSLAAVGPAARAVAPRRMAFLYVPIGAHMANWTPKAEGTNFELTPSLKPLAPYQKDMLVLSGLACDKARPNGDGGGDHARAGGAWLTGCQPRKTAGANFQAGVSVDQIAAKRLGDQTRLPSLELGIERYRGTGNCDSGYSCVYEHTVAWRSADLAVANRGQSEAGVRPLCSRPGPTIPTASSGTNCGPAFLTRSWKTRAAWRSNWAGPTSRNWTSI